jgi:uncharacterized damage-inducible protein DinB
MKEKEDILESLRRVPVILSEMVRSIPEERLGLRRGKNFWTIAEHVSHLAEVQVMGLERFKRFIQEEHPVFVPYVPPAGQDQQKTPGCMEINVALDQFARSREEQLRLLAGVDPAVWARPATHPEYERYTLFIFTRHVLMHDYWHMYRMEELWLTRDEHLAAE